MSDLTNAEAYLLDCLREDKVCDFRNIRIATNNKPKIRGGFLKKIILGELTDCPSIPSIGLKLYGAVIVGDIVLNRCVIEFDIEICYSKIFGKIDLRNSRLNDFILKGSKVEQLIITNAYFSGGVVLSYGFETLQPVMAANVIIKGQLGCSGGAFRGKPLAIHLESANIRDFFWRDIVGLWGIIDLTNVSVGCLIDHDNSWPEKGMLYIDGFTFQSLGGNTSINFFERLRWLELQPEDRLGYDFRPQPFEQLVSVLKKTGHEKEAKNIAVKKLCYQRDSVFARRDIQLVKMEHDLNFTANLNKKLDLLTKIEKHKQDYLSKFFVDLFACVKLIWSYLYYFISGYGFYPLRCLMWGVLSILFGSLVFEISYHSGLMVPKNVFILVGEWAKVEANVPSEIYSEFYLRVPEYQRFNSLIYSIDLFVPFIDLSQDEFWVLTNSYGSFLSGWKSYFAWFYGMLGWLITAILAASLAGVVRK